MAKQNSLWRGRERVSAKLRCALAGCVRGVGEHSSSPASFGAQAVLSLVIQVSASGHRLPRLGKMGTCGLRWDGVGLTLGNSPVTRTRKVLLTSWFIMIATRLRHIARYVSTATTMMKCRPRRSARGFCSIGVLSTRRARERVPPDQCVELPMQVGRAMTLLKSPQPSGVPLGG